MDQDRSPDENPGNQTADENPIEKPQADTVRDLRSSDPDTDPGPEGGMGLSSERVAYTGPGQHASTGVKDTAKQEIDPDADVAPEQRPGDYEPKPEGLPPKGGYSNIDPRKDDEVWSTDDE